MKFSRHKSSVRINVFPDHHPVHLVTEPSQHDRKLQHHSVSNLPSVGSNLISVYASAGNETTRGGFNLSDFSDSTHESICDDVQQAGEQSCGDEQRNLAVDVWDQRANVYTLLESSLLTFFLAAVLLVDACACLVSYVQLLQGVQTPGVERFYRALDYISTVVFFAEINARLYCYSVWFYFGSALYALEYVITMTATILFVSSLVTNVKWVLVMRLIRLLRITTLLALWRERKVKWKARCELQEVARTLERDTIAGKGLAKWKLHSEDIYPGERIGHGGFGTVHLALFRGTMVAIKQVAASEREASLASIEEEAITLVNLRHPNILLFMGLVCEPSKLWIVTEYCSRGSLRDVLDDETFEFTEQRIYKIALGAARGLAYLHGQSPPVLHLDLKTSNILISAAFESKLGDFGLSRNVTNIEKDGFSATMQYCAPEILEANMFSTAADVYSLGVCLWEMATREVPFGDRSPTQVLWGVVKSNLRPPIDAIKVLEPQQCINSAMDGNKRCSERSGADELVVPELGASNIGPGKDAVQLGVTSVICSGMGKRSPSQVIRSSPAVHRMDAQSSNMAKDEHRTVNDGARGTGVVPGNKNQMETGGQCDPQNERCKEERGRSVSDLRPSRLSKLVTGEQASQLADLTRRVTASIKKLDDRPPIARLRGPQNQQEDLRDETGTEEDEDILSAPKLAQVIKNTFKSKLNIKETVTGAKEPGSQEASPAAEVLPVQNNSSSSSDAFARRMENFAGSEFGGLERKRTAGCKSDVEEESSTIATVPVRKEYIELIKKCWAQDPKLRPSASQVVWDLIFLFQQVDIS